MAARAWRIRHGMRCAVRELQDLREQWREHLMAENIAQSVMTLMERLFGYPIVSAPRAEEVLGVTYRRASLAIQRMAESGILKEIAGSARPRRSAAAETMQVLGA